MALPPYDPNFAFSLALGRGQVVKYEHDHEHDESVSAAVVAADLISSTRLALKLDSVHTEYSAQYFLDKVAVAGQSLTVKECLEFAFKNGIPKAEDWPLLGSGVKPSPSHKPALVSMRGKVDEADNFEQVREVLKDQPVGARMHVYTPHIDLQQDGIYCGPSGEAAKFVGLRDVIVLKVEKIYGKSIATVKVWYKKKFVVVKVAVSRMLYFSHLGIGPAGLLVDFCIPRLSID
ncbi:unnamed protein product [Microthlaspi erraticum]|uniref:Uncharacterized protein n=1 Tax=Microthlaspi erraticum TaxID=1685480 RepID=A0A6D2IV25_9BRAS|nr:unnamed protein product [Microthlaspi erraticum]